MTLRGEFSRTHKAMLASGQPRRIKIKAVEVSPPLIITAPPCRVLRDFEPAFAGGILPVTFALAEAYRVVHRTTDPIYQVLAQNLLLHHEHSRV